MTEQKNCEFALFIDESGSPKPNPKDTTPYFALGGVLVKRVDEAIIEQAVADFKQCWNISLDTPSFGGKEEDRIETNFPSAYRTKEFFIWWSKQIARAYFLVTVKFCDRTL